MIDCCSRTRKGAAIRASCSLASATHALHEESSDHPAAGWIEHPHATIYVPPKNAPTQPIDLLEGEWRGQAVSIGRWARPEAGFRTPMHKKKHEGRPPANDFGEPRGVCASVVRGTVWLLAATPRMPRAARGQWERVHRTGLGLAGVSRPLVGLASGLLGGGEVWRMGFAWGRRERRMMMLSSLSVAAVSLFNRSMACPEHVPPSKPSTPTCSRRPGVAVRGAPSIASA